MSTIVTRAGKGSPLTHAELDANFTNLNTDKVEVAVGVTLTGTQTLTNKTLTSPVINTPTGIVKGDVGLGNVDNTSDATKDAATATLTNKTLTAPTINAATLTGVVTAPTQTAGDNSTKVATTAYVDTSFVPAGAVIPFAMNSIPTGWLACDGAPVSRTTYAVLFAAIDIVYGAGDASTTFNVPDLRGMFVRGLGTTGTHAAGAIGVLQEDAFEAHVHSQLGTYSNGGFNGTDAGHILGNTSNTGSTGDIAETRPANFAMLYCIKY